MSDFFGQKEQQALIAADQRAREALWDGVRGKEIAQIIQDDPFDPDRLTPKKKALLAMLDFLAILSYRERHELIGALVEWEGKELAAGIRADNEEAKDLVARLAREIRK
jgi:hypothetical protein